MLNKIEEYLSDAGKMSSLVCDFAHYHLKGFWFGSSHGSHPRGVIRNSILFQDGWNSNNYVYIKIPDKPGIEFHAAENAPTCMTATDTPHPKEGKLHTVWRCGKWATDDENIKKLVIKTLEELISELEAAKKEKIKREKKKKKEDEAELQRKKKELKNNWS